MVGHTGVMAATVTAVEATDVALGIVIDALEKRGGVALITADHGNAEFMADPATGQAHTAHTTYPVPLIIFDPSYTGKLKDGALFDVAPTFLGMLGIAKPAEMTGHDLRIANPSSVRFLVGSSGTTRNDGAARRFSAIATSPDPRPSGEG